MRISRHQMFQEIAHTVAKRSTCFRESVGAVIVRDNRVISIGYNGPASGEPHCEFHPKGKCDRSIHAESNAIKFAGDQLKRSCDLYVTHLPCPICTSLIIQTGFIKRVFFTTMYGDPEPIYHRLDDAEGGVISLIRILPNGTLTDWNRETILDEEA